MKPSAILVIQHKQLGDILLTTPLFREIKSLYPDCHLGVLTHEVGKKILEKNPYIDHHFCYESMSLPNLFSQLQKYDVVMDLTDNPRSKLQCLLARRAKLKIGLHSANAPRSFVYDSLCPTSPLPYTVHERCQFLKVLTDSYNVSTLDPQLDLAISRDDELFAETFFKTSDKYEKKYRVIFSPTHSHRERRWPYFPLLAKKCHRAGLDVFWAWGPGELNFVSELAKDYGKLLPQTTLPQLAACIKNADFFITTRNGPSQLAVAVGTPSFQLHGPTRLERWCPLNDKHQGVEKQPLHELSCEEVLETLENHPHWPRFFSSSL